MVKTKIKQLINSPPIQFGISSTEKKTISNFEVQNDLNELVLDSIGDAILLINPYNYEILSANKIASQLFKLKKEKMIGKTCYQVTHHKSTPCIPPNDVCPLQEMLKTQKPVVVEHSHFNEENRKIELEISVYPIKDKDGKIIQVAHIEKDITKRKTQEREEKTLSNELNAIIDGVGDLLFVIDKNRVILRVNKTTCDVFNKKPEELIGKHCYEIVHGTESPYCNCPATKTFQTKSSAIVEINDPTLGMQLLVTTSPILDEQGNVAQVIHVAKDITIIKQAEMESQVAATFFDAASDSILVHDLDGHIVYFNEAAYKTRGYTREEFQTLTINDLEVPGNPRFFGTKMNELLEKGQARFEALNLCRDKKTIPVEVHAQAVVFDEEKLILSVARDISERNAAQEKLKQAEDMYKTFLTEANVLVQSIDQKGSFIFVNEEWKKSLGYCNEDIKNLSISDVIQKEHIQNCLDVFSQVVKGASIRDVETVFVTKSGKEVFVSGNACPIFKKGKFFSTIAFFEDISERKITEKNLAESSNRIKLMNEKLRVVGSLTRHDVRNKLSAVTGYAYLLKRKHSDQTDIVEGLSKIEQAVKDTVKIFEFAKMYEQLGAEELTPINVETKLNEAIILFSGSVPKIVNGCRGLTLLADSFLRQLFYNFIDNTLKYGQKTTTIHVYFQKVNDDCLKLIYEDDGVGISFENKLNLFKEGFSTGGSTGFGLFLIKKMMDIYGWSIMEEGKPGIGVKFTITIPKLNQGGRRNYH